MSAACRSFRGLLERELERATDAGPARDDRSLAPLSWHEHLLACERCRDLLAAEEALEELLATLPSPRLPRELATRVLARLRDRARDAGEIDELLALDRADAPPGLGERVLAGVRARREHAAADALDRLLERARPVEVPGGLAARVLARVAQETVPAPRPSGPRAAARSSAWRRFAYAIAAGVLALLGATWWTWSRQARDRASEPPLAGGSQQAPPVAGGADAPVDGVPRDAAPLEEPGEEPVGRDAVVGPELVRGAGPATLAARAPEDALLEALPVLEQWDLLMQDEIDALLSTIDPAEQVLLEHGEPAPAADAAREKG